MTLTRIFWMLFTLEAVAYGILMLWTVFGDQHWGPEGPVGAWLIFAVPPLMLGIPAAIFLLGKSYHAREYAIFGLALPLIQMVVGPIYGAFENFQTQRRLAGDTTFFRPAQRKLAHALRAHDAALVKSLIPAAGDLNRKHRDESLFRFALINADNSAASLEIIKAMLDAGANPKVQTPSGNWPLSLAMSNGPAMADILLGAGADPNSMDGDRPVWWDVLYHSTDEAIQTLRVLLDYGADVTRRDSNNGPVGWAAYHKNWQAVWLLMEHGAAWKEERAFDEPVPHLLESDLQYRRTYHSAIADEMLKIQAKYESRAPSQ